MNFNSYIHQELLALIPALYFIGYFIKKKFDGRFNRYIPITLILLGISLALMYGLAPPSAGEPLMIVWTSIVQGILCASVAVTCNQVIKQAKEGGKG